MGPNTGFGNNGFLQNSLNQDTFPTSSFTGGVTGRPYFPQQAQSDMIGFKDDGNGEGYMNNAFQPEVGLFNDAAFSQNLFNSPLAQVSVTRTAQASV
jgi:hypothetical protein